MARPVILAIDQGTTNTKAVLISREGDIAGSGSVPTGVSYPQPGWAEQSGEAILASTSAAIARALAAAPGAHIIGIAISNQRETVLAWDARSGQSIGPAVIWQCRRSASLCAALRSAGHEPLVRARSGLGLDPLFSAGKLRWLLDHCPDAARLNDAGHLRMGTVDAWLLWHLTGGATHATDASNASRTQLLSLDTLQWDPDLLEIFGVPAAALPTVLPSDSRFGHTAGGFAGLPDGVPIHAMMGDSHASLFGHGIRSPGQVKVTIGTGSSLMCPTGARRPSVHGLSETIAWSAGGEAVHALEGNITVSGHTAAFTCDLLGLDGPDALTDLALTVPDSDGVSLVPALAGLGAPHWNDAARGLICGMTLGTRPAHIARAALEAIAHQICDVVEAMEADLGQPVTTISADGSAAGNDLLLQMLADLSGRAVLRPANTQLSAMGVAMMAARALGQPIAPSDESAPTRFAPAGDHHTRDRLRAQWRSAIARATMVP